jgi:hypothetical protein
MTDEQRATVAQFMEREELRTRRRLKKWNSIMDRDDLTADQLGSLEAKIISSENRLEAVRHQWLVSSESAKH